MTFLEHLDELRKRITHAVVALLVGFLIAFAFVERISTSSSRGSPPTSPTDTLDLHRARRGVFPVHQDRGARGRLLIASPYVMWQVWLFIAPGPLRERKETARCRSCFSRRRCSSRGAAFSHYILFPLAWRFFASFSNEYIEFMPRVEPVFGLYVQVDARHWARSFRCRC